MNHRSSEDLALDLEAVAGRDVEAMRRLHHATCRTLYAVCVAIVSDREAAQDVLQEVYTKVWNRARGYDRDRGQPLAWLAMAARNSAIDRLRAQSRHRHGDPAMLETVIDDREPVDEDLERQQQGERAVQSLDELDPASPALIHDAFIGGLTYTQLADSRGMPLDTVKSRIRRGLLHMRQSMPKSNRGTRSEERQVFAAEYALGLLDGFERLEAERLALHDADFAAAVEDWRQRSAGWLVNLPEEEPAGNSWMRIEAALARQSQGEEPRHEEPVHEDAAYQEPVQDVPVRRSVVWPLISTAASLAAVLFAGLWLNQRGDVAESDAPLVAEAPRDLAEGLSVAQISGDAEAGGWLLNAAYNEEDGTLYLRLNDVETNGRLPELWVIGPEGPPRSLGFVDEGSQTIVLTREMQQQMIAGSTLAISLEDPAGIPHEAPQGPILGTAVLAPLADASLPAGPADEIEFEL